MSAIVSDNSMAEGPTAASTAVPGTASPATAGVQRFRDKCVGGNGFIDPPCANPAQVRALAPCGGHVYCWGRGDLGQLGTGTEEGFLLPQPIAFMEGRDVVHVAGNVYHSAFLTGSGELFMAGNNDNGQLGVKGREQQTVPVRVGALDTFTITHVACGQSHTAAVTDQGQLVTWGAAEFGQLGHGGESVDHIHPKFIKGLKDRFLRVACGSAHTLALTGSGRVFSWGQGTFGALGHGNDNNCDVPKCVASLWSVGIVQVACGENHSAALAADGRIFTWGRGKYGQLGLGNFQSSCKPTQVPAPMTAIQVACGGDHTVALSDRGEVFSWGRGTWGQTGLGATDNVCRPSRIQALEGEAVVQVSAGSCHTVMLTASNELWACGNGESGQLGSGSTRNSLTPRRVEGLPRMLLLFAVAAGDHVIAVGNNSPEADGQPVGPHPCRPHGAGCMPIMFPALVHLAHEAAGDDKQAVTQVVQAIDDVFTSPGFLVSGFSLPRGELQTLGLDAKGVEPHNLDITAVTDVYQALLKLYKAEVVSALCNACLRLLEQMESSVARREGRGSSDGNWMRVVLILLQSPLMSDTGVAGAALMHKLVGVVNSLDGAAQQVMSHWLGTLPPEILGGRIIRGAQKHLTWMVQHQDMAVSRSKVLGLAQLLGILHDANERSGGRVAYTELYNEAVSSGANLRDEYLLWIQGGALGSRSGRRSNIVSLCQAPFLLTPEAKARILQGESAIQKKWEVEQSITSALHHGVPPGLVVYLDIRIDRSRILQDSLSQILHRPRDLKKPLHVTFTSNGVPEEGVDQGGVSREFFQLLVEEIFKEDYGMFVYQEETRTFWFNHISLESELNFQLVGIVLGLAIYNQVILDVHFPQVVYKKLLGLKPDLGDLKDTMPQTAKGLQQLLDFEGDVEGTFCRTFEVEYDFFGEMKREELMDGGSSVPVTSENRHKYVDLYMDWLLNGSIHKQFQAFAHGFHQVCGGSGGVALGLFRHEELELLVCGLPHLDFHQLEKGAKYEGGYHPNHPAIRNFWSVLHSLPLDAKKRFLFFTTGCARAPVGGLQQLTLTIQRSGPDSERLPSSHTCFNVLLLPEYESKQKLQEKLLVAIENSQGFGLQ